MDWPAVNLRVARSSDAEQIASLHAASWRYAYRGALSDEFLAGDIVADRLALWTKRLLYQIPGQHVVVAEYEAEIIGFACAFAGSDDQWGILLDNLHVSQLFQGKGVGRRLMSSIAEWGAEISPSQGLFLWVVQANVQAQKFYERLGASKAGSDVWSPPGGGQVLRYRYAWSSVRLLLSPTTEGGAA